ncbi:SMR family transporter [Barnesiella propionica]|uniref:DMT family transporter n=1 Tax=Barnesiella propionica TaxID=2981781 RepID=UPI0011CC0062|nr:SMR family transporter [Barnesiella propionica]MCU6768829.1 SMR family transporter [Barnesiella propionica]
MKPFIFLFIAIIFETVATSALKASEQFTRIFPSALTIIGYLVAFYCLSITLKTIPVGIAYAIWSGVGIILISLVGIFFFKQALDLPSIIGLVLIVLGVLIINVFSKLLPH